MSWAMDYAVILEANKEEIYMETINNITIDNSFILKTLVMDYLYKFLGI